MPTLNWVGKDRVVNHHHDVPFRVLKKSYTFSAPLGTPTNSTDNRIIRGDNLEALKSLLPEFEGRVKCIYIDPPYNTGNEGWVYNDAVNDPRIMGWIGKVVGREEEDLSRHDKWLCMMYPRMKLLHSLLANDGVLFASIGQDEFAAFRLLLEEIFGRQNALAMFIWLAEGNVENAEAITTVHEYVIAVAKSKSAAKIMATVDPNADDDSKLLRDFAENSVIKNGPANPGSIVTLPVGFPCSTGTLRLKAHESADEFLSVLTAPPFRHIPAFSAYPSAAPPDPRSEASVVAERAMQARSDCEHARALTQAARCRAWA